MKKTALLLMLCMVFALSACGTPTPNNGTGSTKHSQGAEAVEAADPFYTKMQETKNVRPIAVMIDNDEDKARPQIGLESAYMVYEIVVEGKATRFMALFKDHSLEKVGPTRSSRHYFLDYALEHDAIYCHAGWSPKAAKDISALGVNNINGVAGDDSVYWRDNTYDKTWHNLYTGTQKLAEYAENNKKYRMTTENEIPNYNPLDTVPENGEDVAEISIPYANFYQLTYKYDAAQMRYVRYINGKEHMSQTGEALSTKNIILYQLQNVTLNDGENKGRQDLKNIGSGEGYYFSDGKMVKIKWSKSAREAKTVYTLEDGTPLALNPGNTFVQIVPNYVTLSMK